MNEIDPKLLKFIDGFHESMLVAYEKGEIPMNIYLRYLTHFSCNSHGKEDLAATVAMMREIMDTALKDGWSKAV